MLLMKPRQREAAGSVSGLILDHVTKQDGDLEAVKESAMGPLETSIWG